MNSDPHESAAWRNFGMLDPDESASYDEALRRDPTMKQEFHDMERLTAAIAAATTTPVVPKNGQLERLHVRLGLDPLKRTNWLAITGWAAAVAMGGFVILKSSAPPQAEKVTIHLPQADESPAVVLMDDQPTIEELEVGAYQTQPAPPAGSSVAEIVTEVAENTSVVKVETKRLIQELEVLRENLEAYQRQDRILFEPSDGMAWPVIVRMVPPDTTTVEKTETLTLNPDEPTITAMLGDALAAANFSADGMPPSDQARAYQFAPVNPAPSAIPIYDSARDTGTLVVSNLPEKAPDERYNLWVTTEKGKRPVHVGRIPDSNKPGADSFDFNLGSTKVLPTGFMLTRDKQDKPEAPSAKNTILLGPK